LRKTLAMPRTNPLRRAESTLRRLALAYPETKEEFPWGHRALKVNGKIFLTLCMEKSVLNLSVKLPVSARMALAFPFASPTGYGLGKSGWVTATFGATDVIPVELLQEWVDESYRAIAPRRVLAQLEQAESRGARSTRRKT
jgi:predicted DNA-binding protein (MmcQ/YjbR family)